MNILIKTTLRNIIGKPFRSFLVIFSIFVCSVTAFFCFDIAATESVFFEKAYKVIAGEGDLTILNADIDLSRLPEDFPDYEYMDYRNLTEIVYTDIEGEYYIVHAERLRVTAADVEFAGRLDIIPEGLTLGDGEVIVTTAYANAFDVEIGDMITLHDKNGDPVELEVVNTVPTGTMNLMRRGKSLIVNENTGELLCAGRNVPHNHMINILDDSRVTEAEEMLHEIFPDVTVNRLIPSDSMMDSTRDFMGLMFMLFAIAFLLVIFITASLCERIVSERMSFIGTLRSLGLSARSTGLILLIENIFYALIGSVPAGIIYLLARASLMEYIYITSPDMSNDIVPNMSPFLVPGVILGAVVIECIIPLRAQVKALRVSIRDIIFDNRDTEYKISKTTVALGFVLAVFGVIGFFLRKDLMAASVCLIATVMSVAFLYPLILKGITSFIARNCRKADNERWAMAAVETGSRKSSVGSGILSVSSAAMSIIILSIALSMMGSVKGADYDCDVVVTTISDSAHYEFAERMDGVNEIEVLYQSSPYVNVGGNELFVEFFGMPEDGFKMYTGFAEVPELGEGQIAVDSSWARKNDISAGDVIEITYNSDSVCPIVKQYTVAGAFRNLNMGSSAATFILPVDDYIEVLHDMPGKLLIRCDDPDNIATLIETYAIGLYDEVQTTAEIRQQNDENNRTTVLVFTAIIAIALAMTAIGMTSNQLIGFEGRRKECAVMLSTAMTRETLIGILFRESLLSALISGAIGLVTGTLLVYVIKDALAQSVTLYLPIVFNPGFSLLLWAGLVAVFILTVLFPIRSLKKMKISEQIKCD